MFDDESKTTDSTSPAFTFYFAAPEIFRKEPCNKKSDMFSLSAVFYEILGKYIGIPQFRDTSIGTNGFKAYRQRAGNGTLRETI